MAGRTKGKKSDAESVAENILDILANLSATDSWHDFHGDISRFREVIMDNEKIYCEGLPTGVTTLGTFNDEGLALNNVVISRNGTISRDYGEKLVTYNNKQAFGVKQEPYTIKTINGSEYSVRPLVVAKGSSKSEAGKDYIDAATFMNNLELENESAIIIDATAVSILSILKKGAQVMDGSVRKKMYYVLTPEVVNDPAGKTSVAEKIFDPTLPIYKSGVELIGCEPNVPESINYNYSYDRNINTGEALKSKSTNPYDKFFSAFNFQLSEVQRNRKGKKTDYTTNLLIKSNDKRVTVPENVPDSKTKNNITFLTSLIKNAISMLGKKQDTLANRFLFNTKLQQKRSGDWLQVLACAVLKSRALKQYNPPGTAPREQSIEKKISKVYFVTHDRVALAFALLLGVECIYTHTATKSCYIYKLASPADVALANALFLENKQAELVNILTKITASQKDFISFQTPQLIEYNKFRNANIIYKYPEAIAGIGEKYNSLFYTDAPNFNATEFTKFTCETFELALLFDYLLLNFPDLSVVSSTIPITIDKLVKNISDMKPLIDRGIAEHTNSGTSLSSDSFTLPITDNFSELKNRINDSIALFDSLMAQLSTLQTSLDKYVLDKDPFSIKVKLETTITNFQKSPNRKLASGWSWDNTQGNSRMWEAFKDVIGSTAYKSDKNMFLYNLNLIPDETKEYLCNKYLTIQDIINKIPAPTIVENVGRNPVPIPIPIGGRLTKFNLVTKGFIAEIFLNFGFKIPEPRVSPTSSSVTSPASSSTSPASNYTDAGIYSDDEYCLNGRYELSITRVLTVADPGPLSEDEILSENGKATIISATDENYPENVVKDNAEINYSTEVSPSISEDMGRPITDSESISKSAEELRKNKNELTDIIQSAAIDATENDSQMSSLRKGLEEDDAFKAARNAAILSVIPRTSGSPSTELTQETGNLIEDVKQDIINSTQNDIRESVIKDLALNEEIKEATPLVNEEKDDSFRKAIEPSQLINVSSIQIRRGAKLLGSDFEPNIKDATYVLLNALLGYKCNPDQLAFFRDKIYEISQSDFLRDTSFETVSRGLPQVVQNLGDFHNEGENENQKFMEDETATTSSSGAGGVAVPQPSQYRLRAKYTGAIDSLQSLPPIPSVQKAATKIDSLQSLPKPPGRGMGGGADTENNDLLLAFFEKLNLPFIEREESVDGDIDEDEDFFKSVNYLFHPLLPIYMFAEALNEITGNDNIEDSLDYELYQNYLKFLQKLRENVVQQYASKQPLDIAKAFMIGTCLKELLFCSDVYSLDLKTYGQSGGRVIQNSSPLFQSRQTFDNDDALIDVGKGKIPKEEITDEYHPEEYFEFEQPHSPIPEKQLDSSLKMESETKNETRSYCEDVLGMTKDEFLPVSILTGVFNYFISGIKIRSEEDDYRGSNMLQSELFVNFIRKVNMGNTFKEIIEVPEPISSFKRKCFVFLLETGNIIISDRGGVPLEIPTEEETNVLRPDAKSRRELIASAAESRRDSGLGGSKKNHANKHNHKSRRQGKPKRRITKANRKIKVKHNTKRNYN